MRYFYQDQEGDTFGTSVIGLGFALLSVLALVLYLAKSVDFENALRVGD